MSTNQIEQKKLGLRIKSLRVLTGLNQEEFAQACDFNHTSLRNWEFGRVLPRNDAIDRLIASFQSYSIYVSREWITFGKGEGPVFTQNTNQPNNTEIKWRNEISAFKQSCISMGENPLTVRIEDEAMAPQYSTGDWVAAISQSLSGLQKQANFSQLLKRPMLVKVSESYVLRYLQFDGHFWFARSEHSYRLSKVISDVVGLVIMQISSSILLAKQEPLLEGSDKALLNQHQC
jgi:transcriptional regulator with XRE-family HTH domain